ncbi:MAG TPA: L-histidine N(alpha)-methyltransferase [Calidithermus sp.]|nr:L-histidine N(alpha)-methyltransferase [Calidithermus sp.]
MTTDPGANCRVDVRLDDRLFLTRLADDVRRGLTARPRRLPPKYFYDAAGSALFDRITQLPEYYLTRVEAGLLERVAAEVVDRVGPRDVLELGPGSGDKARRVLAALADRAGIRYVPVDVGRDGLRDAIGALAAEHPWLGIHAVVGDFERDLRWVPPPRGRRLALFLGSTVGNLDPGPRRALLGRVRRLLGRDGALLLGVDLVKPAPVLEAAYDDPAGVTAAFNRNILRVVNRALGGDFEPEAFRHHAFYNAARSRVEMHLIARRAQRVRLHSLGLVLDFAAGEGIWTENSYKFTRQSTAAMLREAGFALEAWYTDPAERFGLALARP